MEALGCRAGLSRYTIAKIETGRPVAGWALVLVFVALDLSLTSGVETQKNPGS